jgi:hypothetical protein
VELPSTLTPYEVRVVILLLLDLKQTEIATVLGVSRSRVRAAHGAVKEKMADWTPNGPGPDLDQAAVPPTVLVELPAPRRLAA